MVSAWRRRVAVNLWPAARQIGAMVAIMLFLGFAPVLALAIVPARDGALRSEVVHGRDAERLLAAKLGPSAKAKYEDFRAEMAASGRERSAIGAVRSFREPVEQSVLRRIAEWVVPTLHARRFDEGVAVYDDYSTYFEPDYVGSVAIFDGIGNDMILGVSFQKDPETDLALNYEYVISCNGCTTPEPASTLGHLQSRLRQAIYPSVYARARGGDDGYWQRYRTCVLGTCAIVAAACFIANVLDGEALWVPCFLAGCGGAEIGCLIYALLPQ